MLKFKLVFILALFFLTATFSIAQENSKLQIIDPPKLSHALDQEKALQYLDEIDEEISKLVGQYTQLSDWELIRKDHSWYSSGKKRTDTGIEYAHNLKQTESSNYLDRYGSAGFHLRVNVMTKEQFMTISGAGIDTIVFGASLGNSCVIASVTSASPKEPKLDKKVSEIINRRLSLKNCMSGGN